MDEFAKRFATVSACKAADTQVIIKKGVRLTVLTPCLIRVEEQKDNCFCDEPTQSVWVRDLGCTPYTVYEGNGITEIKTEKCVFRYSLSEKKMESITLSDGRTVQHFSQGNLKGTCRTLDVGSNRFLVGDGIVSRGGVAVLNDSLSLLLTPSGEILPRKRREKDVYYFAYGSNYIGATGDLYRITGGVELIPRFALANWWSRYKAYTQEEYLSLINRFQAEKIPITVATVDMDWHWVDIKSKFGLQNHRISKHKNIRESFYDFASMGWTGYSVNTDLFPDMDSFLKELHQKNLRVTFNLHPSMGVRSFENQYKEMCRRLRLDAESGQTVPFDITNKDFTAAYFDVLHHPYEEKGVDFWWIDWQQGTHTNTPGLDPLWALNHYHYLDNARNGKRGLILSRFAGVGSQRYPLGFSGDTVQSWQALAFQPWFTATAANICYPWWSHDIGGHCRGKKDDELYLRWLQFGVFNPVMRLHSTSNEFMGKEPWNYSTPVRRIASEYLRFRHRLLPYLYTMNRRTNREYRALCEPMYYTYPEQNEAYRVDNQYFFGSELMVAPITEHTSPKTNMAGVTVWFPKGRYTDIFTGRIYYGNQTLRIFRDIESIPVFAKEGAVIPLSRNGETNDIQNPKEMDILVYRGNNTFTLYEDDGETEAYRNGAYAQTPFRVTQEEKKVTFAIEKAEGDLKVIPEKRSYRIMLKDIVRGEICLLINGSNAPFACCSQNGTLVVTVNNVKPTDTVIIEINACEYLKNRRKKEELTETIAKFQMGNIRKGRQFTGYLLKGTRPCAIHPDFKGPIEEIEGMLIF